MRAYVGRVRRERVRRDCWTSAGSASGSWSCGKQSAFGRSGRGSPRPPRARHRGAPERAGPRRPKTGDPGSGAWPGSAAGEGRQTRSPRPARAGRWRVRRGRGRGGSAQPTERTSEDGWVGRPGPARDRPRVYDTTVRSLLRDGGVGGCAPHRRGEGPGEGGSAPALSRTRRPRSRHPRGAQAARRLDLAAAPTVDPAMLAALALLDRLPPASEGTRESPPHPRPNGLSRLVDQQPGVSVQTGPGPHRA